MRLTIGIPSYNNYTETWFTVQSLRLHHDLTDCEVVILDNFGDDRLADFVRKSQRKGDTLTANKGDLRYVKDVEGHGTGYVRNRIFEQAKGEVVMCADSHVLFARGAIDSIQPTDDLMCGPMLNTSQRTYYTQYLPEWRAHTWGIWGPSVKELPEEPFDIWGMGLGAFYTNRKTWLGFHEKARGFGGIEGVLFEKYRRAGRRVICNPKFVWHHFFRPNLSKPPYKLSLYDRIRNYVMGFEELGMDTTPIKEHYGEKHYNKALETLKEGIR